MKKTVREWLKELPEDVRALAQLRHEQEMLKTQEPEIKLRVSSLKSALWSAFVWMDTPEGQDYWNDIANELP